MCNKEGFGKKRRIATQLVEAITCYSNNDDAKEEDSAQEEEDDQGEKRKKLDECKKRKREKMLYTNCKARMVVKMIGSRWQVIYFLGEHNHDLVLMSEFYGFAQLVPYEGKQVSNFCSTIHKTEKIKDMQETLDYFRALKEEDPDFFCKIKLDDNHRVENLFWVDSAARRAYKEAYSDCVSFDATYMTNIYEMPWQFQYWVEPNNSFVYGYGKRNYLVTTIEEEESYRSLAVEGCTSDENYAILEKHIKQMRSEFEEMKKRKMANRQNIGAIEGGTTEGAQDPGATEHWSRCLYSYWTFTVNYRCSGWSKLIKCREPPKSKAKGRRKEKAHKKGMNSQATRKNRCSVCRSYDHNAQRCPDKPGREVQN
ncbi:uncharacterized protein [Miscanthus floridulus]|uniref:uncharacterized protein n=1 Tax=Miscanthus floridulus TaxID=154761 RepID=UPI0034590BDA